MTKVWRLFSGWALHSMAAGERDPLSLWQLPLRGGARNLHLLGERARQLTGYGLLLAGPVLTPGTHRWNQRLRVFVAL